MSGLSAEYDVKFEMYRDNPVCIGILRKVEDCLMSGRQDEARKLLDMLPTREELMTRLSDHLRGKSIEKTLEKIRSGDVQNKYTHMKALFSVGTHVAIECEKGNEEFAALLDGLLDRLAILISKQDR